MRLPEALPPARGNAYADDLRVAQLGFELFFDARFSRSQELRCASCHQPERVFDDGRPTAHAIADLSRNTPSLLNAVRLNWQLWDGRADTVWSQPLFALENPAEMNFTRLELAHRVRETYRSRYEAVFGALPALENLERFPLQGKPGEPAFEAMTPADQTAINRVAANVGKAFEAYLRKLASGPSRFDRYLDGDRAALTEPERAGVAVYLKAGCQSCHGGAQFSDDDFHNLGIAGAAGVDDPGRSAGLRVLAANPFNARGEFFDGPPEPAPERSGRDLGAFHTPSLRNVARSAPYGHNGRFATLSEVVDFHLAGGGVGQSGFAGDIDPVLKPQSLTPEEREALVQFLGALDGTPPPSPWNTWPDR